MAHETEDPGRPSEREFSSAGLSISRRLLAFGQLLQPEDKVLRAKGGDIDVYKDVLRDDQVQSTFQQRRLAVVSREWAVEPGGTAAKDKRAARALEENLQRIRFDRISDHMLYGLFYGHAVGECMWGVRDGRVDLLDVKARDRARFRFDVDEHLRLLTVDEPQGILMPARKFWRFAAGADHGDEPYGLGLAHWLWWPVFFKRNGLKFWLIFLEKFGQPTTVGKYPQGASEGEQDRLLEAAAAVATEAAVTVPEGFGLELLEAARTGTSTYDGMHDAMNEAISKVVLSQTMTTDQGSSRSQSQTHMEVRDEVVKADADLLSASFNDGPARWLTEWNFPGAAIPQVWRRVEDEPDLKPQAERDKIIFGMGYRPTPEYIESTYGEGFERRAAPQPPSAPPPPGQPPDGDDADLTEPPRCPGCGSVALQEGDRPHDRADELADDLEEAAAGALDPWIDTVRALVERAESLDDVADALLALKRDMGSAELAELMRNALFIAEASGRADIADG